MADKLTLNIQMGSLVHQLYDASILYQRRDSQGVYERKVSNAYNSHDGSHSRKQQLFM